MTATCTMARRELSRLAISVSMDALLSASVPSRSKTMRRFMRSSSAGEGHFQQTDDTVRPAAAGSHHGRQEQHITPAEGITSTGVLDLTVPGKAHQYARCLRCTDDEGCLPFDPRDTELVTLKQPLA